MEKGDKSYLLELKKSRPSFLIQEQPQLCDVFFQTSSLQHSLKIKIELRWNSIKIIKKSLVQHVYEFDSTTILSRKFQIIKVNQQSVIGFVINLGTKIFKFYSESQIILDKWISALEKIMIRWGFYEDYKPIDKIGEGKFASVFMAIRKKDNVKVAIKAFLKAELLNQEKGIDGLKKQIQILRELKNQHIIRLYAVYETEKSFYLVLQHIEGKQLRKVLEQRIIGEEEIKKIIHNLALGLTYLESKNIVHRDIKPQNIVYNEQTKNCVIVDFGLATFSYSTTHVYNSCGTPGFVSPQYFQNKPIQSIGDVFSLGVSLHLMMFRKLPFPGQSNQQILSQNRQGKIVLSSKGHFSQKMYDLLQKMLQISPTKRITAQQILSHPIFNINEDLLSGYSPSRKSMSERQTYLQRFELFQTKKSQNTKTNNDNILGFEVQSNKDVLNVNCI